MADKQIDRLRDALRLVQYRASCVCDYLPTLPRVGGRLAPQAAVDCWEQDTTPNLESHVAALLDSLDDAEAALKATPPETLGGDERRLAIGRVLDSITEPVRWTRLNGTVEVPRHIIEVLLTATKAWPAMVGQLQSFDGDLRRLQEQPPTKAADAKARDIHPMTSKQLQEELSASESTIRNWTKAAKVKPRSGHGQQFTADEVWSILAVGESKRSAAGKAARSLLNG